ncbi:MAG: hypothetical protein ABW190_04165 [Rhizobacter sp.]
MRPATWRRTSVLPEQDPGDMGTAFGLDASMAPLGTPLPPADARPLGDSFWQHRLDRRPQR